jgi:hypothetical protein
LESLRQWLLNSRLKNKNVEGASEILRAPFSFYLLFGNYYINKWYKSPDYEVVLDEI